MYICLAQCLRWLRQRCRDVEATAFEGSCLLLCHVRLFCSDMHDRLNLTRSMFVVQYRVGDAWSSGVRWSQCRSLVVSTRQPTLPIAQASWPGTYIEWLLSISISPWLVTHVCRRPSLQQVHITHVDTNVCRTIQRRHTTRTALPLAQAEPTQFASSTFSTVRSVKYPSHTVKLSLCESPC